MPQSPLNDADQALIERYLQQRLLSGDEQAFEARMQEESFRKEVDWQQQLRGAVKSHSQFQLKAALQQTESDIRQREPKARNLRPLWMSAAAALLLLLSLWFLFPKTNKTKTLYATYYNPYPNELVKIERSNAQLSQQQQTFVYYQSGAYAKALEGFDLWLADSPQSDALFYKAISLMGLDRQSEALPILESIANKQQHRFRPAAQWYAALAALQTKQFEEARQWLQKVIADKSGYNRKAAKEILEKLNSQKTTN